MTNCDWWSIKWNIKSGIEDFHSSLPYDPLILLGKDSEPEGIY
jgi:hypothetical protein